MPEDAPTSRPETLRELTQFLSYLRPYRRRFALAMAASMISMSFGGLFPFLVGKLLDASIPSVKVIPISPWLPNLNTIALVLMGTLLIQAVLTFVSSLTFNIIGERAVVDLPEPALRPIDCPADAFLRRASRRRIVQPGFSNDLEPDSGDD